MIDQKPFEGDTYIGNELIKLRDRFDIVNCVETGTQYGTTTKELAKLFDTVHTIEADKTYFEIASQKLRGTKADLNFGRSEEIMGWLNLRLSTLFYLDAHGCEIGGCPLKKELEVIRKMDLPLKCIAIHDFKVPGKDFGYDTYDYELCFEEIEEHLKLIYPQGFDYHYNEEADGAYRGILYVYPKTT